jgi:hypothetical protein
MHASASRASSCPERCCRCAVSIDRKCVDNNGLGNWTAHFGYFSSEASAVNISVGDTNAFFPAPSDRGQPTRFDPGQHSDVFTVGFDGSPLVWQLTNHTVTAAGTSRLCHPAPPVRPAVMPFVSCVDATEAGSFVAHFGYLSLGLSSTTVSVGDANHFSPEPANRGQPTAFESGRNPDVFQVSFDGTPLVWSLDGRPATASATSEPCTPPPPPPVLVAPILECVSTLAPDSFVAHFGYLSAASDTTSVPLGAANRLWPDRRTGVSRLCLTLAELPMCSRWPSMARHSHGRWAPSPRRRAQATKNVRRRHPPLRYIRSLSA